MTARIAFEAAAAAGFDAPAVPTVKPGGACVVDLNLRNVLCEALIDVPAESADGELDHLFEQIIALLKRQTGCTRFVAELSLADIRADARERLHRHLNVDWGATAKEVPTAVHDFVRDGGDLESGGVIDANDRLTASKPLPAADGALTGQCDTSEQMVRQTTAVAAG